MAKEKPVAELRVFQGISQREISAELAAEVIRVRAQLQTVEGRRVLLGRYAGGR